MAAESANFFSLPQELQDMIYNNAELVHPFDLKMKYTLPIIARGETPKAGKTFRAHVQNATDFRTICALRQTCRRMKDDVDQMWEQHCTATLHHDSHIYHSNPSVPGEEEPIPKHLLPTRLIKKIKTVIVTDTAGFLFSKLLLEEDESSDTPAAQIAPRKRSDTLRSVVQCSFHLSVDKASRGPDLSIVAPSHQNSKVFELMPCQVMVRQSNRLMDRYKDSVAATGFDVAILFNLSVGGLCVSGMADSEQTPFLRPKRTRSMVQRANVDKRKVRGAGEVDDDGALSRASSNVPT